MMVRMQAGTQVKAILMDSMEVTLQAPIYPQSLIMPSMLQPYQFNCCQRPGRLTLIGQPLNLCNWLPDSGASSHLTPHLADLVHVEEELDLGVEVADGHIVKCTARGCVTIDMTDDDGFPLQAQLYDVIYIPGLK